MSKLKMNFGRVYARSIKDMSYTREIDFCPHCPQTQQTKEKTMDKETRYSLAKLKAFEDSDVHTWVGYDSLMRNFVINEQHRSNMAEKLLEGIQDIFFENVEDYDGDEVEKAIELILNTVEEFKKESK